jgi:hypothetical protein
MPAIQESFLARAQAALDQSTAVPRSLSSSAAVRPATPT